MNRRNFKTQFESELGCTLMQEEEELFWTALSPATPKDQAQRAEEKLYDLLQARGVRVK